MEDMTYSTFGSFSWLLMLPLGVALHWAIAIVYGHRPMREKPAAAINLLSMLATLMILVGLIGPLLVMGMSWILFFVMLVIISISITRYRLTERRQLLWAIAAAAEYEQPLPESIRAFAADRCDEVGRRATILAENLERGVPLAAALYESRTPLSIDAQLTTELARNHVQLGQLLRKSARLTEKADQLLQPLLMRMAYLTIIITVLLSITTFYLIKILPTMEMMFREFEVSVPILNHVRDWSSTFLTLTVPVQMLLVVGITYGTAVVLGWITWEPPGVRWLTRRYHGSLVLRALSGMVVTGWSIADALPEISSKYPRTHVRQRLYRAAERTLAGGKWQVELQKVGLISPADAAVLESAERAGNLPWALEEMADSAGRRFVARISAITNIVAPMMIILVGTFVALLVFNVMVPLVDLIHMLA